MSVTNKSGFTIIETMLFLAVSGLLIMSILAGTGTSINIQRYRDSVSTFKDLMQQQYSDVTTVRNEVRSAGISCDESAVIGAVAGLTKVRGQSDCVILGRYVSIIDTEVSISSVVGNTSSTATGASDIEDLKRYSFSTLQSSTETSELEWGARIAWPATGAGHDGDTMPRTISFLILRSPQSGLVYTFSSNASSTSGDDLKSMIVAGNTVPGQLERRICVDSDGGFGGGLAVLFGAYASSASSVEVRSNDFVDESGMKC